MLNFVWDINKAETNIKKHRVSFDKASEALKDEFGLDDFDESHLDFSEYRYSRIGLSLKGVLFVVYIVKDENSFHLIISARKAEKSEEKLYWEARYE